MRTILFRNRRLIVADETMEQTLTRASRAALSKMPVLIVGPSGTGKELIARYIHEKSERKAAPFISVNCAAIPDGLMESELFGYERGAFTGALVQRIGKFEQAHRGTLLLDEVSEMPLHLQAKLLRVLQEHEIDRLGGGAPISIETRIIATTNLEPLELVRKGLFRADLFYRLNVIRIDCVPLSHRRDGIRVLAGELLREICDSHGVSLKEFSPEAVERLCSHTWPGNVRELQNVIERATLLSDHPLLDVGDLDLRSPEIYESVALSGVERRHILGTLNQTDGNRTEAAKRLGISVRTLRNKIKEFGV
jgi:transcriptional regulator with PAS, ATPase and Fis domain